MVPRLQRVASRLATVAAVVLATLPVVRAERAEPLPAELEGVGITQKVGAEIPLDLEFLDENGNTVRLAQFFNTGRPVLLDLGYYECPMLCNLVLNGMVDSLKRIPFKPGRDFDVVVVTINPLEPHTLAKAKKNNYVRAYGDESTAGGWHFLSGGGEANIKKLADAVGFGYRWVADRAEYAHAAALIIVTPEGKVSHYLTGVQYDPPSVRLALADAGQGRIGTVMDQVLLYCFQYDPQTGKYSLAALRLVQATGLLTALVLGSVLGTFWIRESRRRRSADAE